MVFLKTAPEEQVGTRQENSTVKTTHPIPFPDLNGNMPLLRLAVLQHGLRYRA
jgi:hypothetical protein